MTDLDPTVARRTWRTVEPIHGMIYFSPEAAAAYEQLGLTGRMGYFASRAAPMGAVSAELVIATFFNFRPALVRASIPEAWDHASPAEILAARVASADAAL
ncbi:MAG: SCO6745 family protein, partial [Acidimicrobiia bacterium]